MGDPKLGIALHRGGLLDRSVDQNLVVGVTNWLLLDRGVLLGRGTLLGRGCRLVFIGDIGSGALLGQSLSGGGIDFGLLQ